MSILFLALRVLGVVLLAVLALAAVAMLLPAGLDIRWRRGGPLEVWLTAGPLRRKFFPFPEETPPGGKKGAAKMPDAAPSAAPKAPAPAEKSGGGPPPEVPPAPEPPQAETAAPAKPAAASPEEEFEAMLGKLMSDPMRHVRRGQQWAKGPGRFLLARLRVRHLRIVWTVTEQDAAATAVTYGALMAACNTAWAILRDHVDAKADELRLEPDFTGERAAERCFACQITARMYIIVATALLTMQAAAKRRAARARRRDPGSRLAVP